MATVLPGLRYDNLVRHQPTLSFFYSNFRLILGLLYWNFRINGNDISVKEMGEHSQDIRKEEKQHIH